MQQMEAVYDSAPEAPPSLRALPVRGPVIRSDGLSIIAICTYALVLSALLLFVIILAVLLRNPASVSQIAQAPQAIPAPTAKSPSSEQLPSTGRLLAVPVGASSGLLGSVQGGGKIGEGLSEQHPALPKNPRFQSSPEERLRKIKLPEVVRTHFRALTEEEKATIEADRFFVKGRRPQFFKPGVPKKGEARGPLPKRPVRNKHYGY